jgi:hypothetical protein
MQFHLRAIIENDANKLAEGIHRESKRYRTWLKNCGPRHPLNDRFALAWMATEVFSGLYAVFLQDFSTGTQRLIQEYQDSQSRIDESLSRIDANTRMITGAALGDKIDRATAESAMDATKGQLEMTERQSQFVLNTFDTTVQLHFFTHAFLQAQMLKIFESSPSEILKFIGQQVVDATFGATFLGGIALQVRDFVEHYNRKEILLSDITELANEIEAYCKALFEIGVRLELVHEMTARVRENPDATEAETDIDTVLPIAEAKFQERLTEFRKCNFVSATRE